MVNEYNAICVALSYQKDTTTNYIKSSFSKFTSVFFLSIFFSATSHISGGHTLIQNLNNTSTEKFFLRVKRKVFLNLTP